MIVLTLARRCGKTYNLIQWLKCDPDKRVVVVITESARRDLMLKYNLSPNQVMTYQEIEKPGYGDKEFGLDDLDWFVSQRFRKRIGMVTLTSDKQIENPHFPHDELS